MSKLVSFNKITTREQALTDIDSGKIYFPIDATSIIVDGKEYGVGAGSASDIEFNPSYTYITSTNVQDAIEEVVSYISENEEIVAFALNDLNSRLNEKQDELVSGTNVKTINGNSVLGSGDLTISAGVASDVEFDNTIKGQLRATNVQGAIDETVDIINTNAQTTAQAISELENEKQDVLQSGITIKTINNQNLLGYGNITIGGGSSYAVEIEYNNAYTGYLVSKNVQEAIDETLGIIIDNEFITSQALTYLDSELINKQEVLVSGTNIKTINGNSILGSGDIEISSGSSYAEAIEFNKDKAGYLTSDNVQNAIDEVVSYLLIDEKIIAASLNDLNTRINEKQDTISDLNTIRSGAALGATALQEEIYKGTVTSVAVQMNGATKGTVTTSGTIDLGTVLTEHQDISGKADIEDIPTVTSDLTNDSGFITNSVNDLANYYLKSETYTQTEVNNLIDVIKQFDVVVADSLPTASESTQRKMYLIPSEDSQEGNVKEEHITLYNGTSYYWELIGSTAIDLTGYATEEYVDNEINDVKQIVEDNELVTATALTYLNTAVAGKANISHNHNGSEVIYDGTAYPEFIGKSMTEGIDFLTSSKQNVISDLDIIRSGAALGATALQEETYKGTVTSVNNIAPVNGNVTISIPTEVTESTVSGWGFTKNEGTVTSVAVQMNGATKGTVTSSGTIDLGTVLTEHQDISGKANDNEVVHLTGSETVSGSKTFADGIQISTNGIYVSGGGLNVANGGATINGSVSANSITVNTADFSGFKNITTANLQSALNTKQNVLIGDPDNPGQNIKTINGYNILGSGNIYIQGGGGGDYFPGDGIDINQATHVISVNSTIPGDKVFTDSICVGDPDDTSENFVGIAPGNIYAPTSGINAASIRVHSTQPFDNIIDIRNGAEFTLYQALAAKQNTVIAGSGINLSSSDSRTISVAPTIAGSTTVSSISAIPVTHRAVLATVSANGTLSFAALPQDGYEVHVIIRNSSSSTISITLPSSGSYICTSETTIYIAAGKYGEVNVVTIGTTGYIHGMNSI